MINKKREVFLFGAGAVIDWGGPTTTELTDLIRKSGFRMKGSDTTITEFIYQKLIETGYSEDEINFETILSVIEELMVYYSENDLVKIKGRKTRPTSFLRPFIDDAVISDIFNYSIKGKIRQKGYKLQIPFEQDYIFAKEARNNENPNQFFLQHLLALLLSTISNRVSKYAWNTDTHSVIDKKSEISLLFRRWMKSISEKSILRLYTLNYDYIFRDLLAEEKIYCFDGSYEKSSRPDVLKITTDTNCNTHYNLHGAASWVVLGLGKKDLYIPEINMGKGIHIPVNDIYSVKQIEKGKSIFISNIISGYQKAQKSVITPFRQFQSAFDKDVYLADTLTVIGYSFGDEHINEAIYTALLYNKKLKIIIVDPCFIENVMDSKLSMRMFPYIESDKMNPVQFDKDMFSYYNGTVEAYNMTFVKYLNEMKNLKL